MTAKGWLLLALYEHPEGIETTIEVSRQSDTTDHQSDDAARQPDTTARQPDTTAHQPDTTAKIQCLDQLILAQFIYDIEQNTAHCGSAKIDGPALRWTLFDGRALNANASTPNANASTPNANASEGGRHIDPNTALTSAVSLDSADRWVEDVSHLDQAALVSAVSLDSADRWVMRCDRVDFSPAAAAHPHTHPGPGIRRLLFGELTVTTAGVTSIHRAGGVWFESGPDIVYAEASPTEETAFVRVMLLPSEWAGKRTIRYADTAIAAGITTGKQRATILGEELLDTPEHHG